MMSGPVPDAREVDRVEAVITVTDSARAETFLERCVPGSLWSARIRTAEVDAWVENRHPLGSFDERLCTCIRLRLALPVPVEPGLRFQIVAPDDPDLTAAAVVRPWGSR